MNRTWQDIPEGHTLKIMDKVRVEMWTSEYTYANSQCGQSEGNINTGIKDGVFIRRRNSTMGTALDYRDNLFDFFISNAKILK